VAITHDELLIKIDNFEPDDELDSVKSMNALRAVVELHKPDEPDFPDEWESCVECSGNGYVAMYPCQTIKAIEKELE
jgi:hypothetical protein